MNPLEFIPEPSQTWVRWRKVTALQFPRWVGYNRQKPSPEGRIPAPQGSALPALKARNCPPVIHGKECQCYHGIGKRCDHRAGRS